ncbi:hypothetical protein GCM10023087_26300 [Microbacterium rhizosphaerae]
MFPNIDSYTIETRGGWWIRPFIARPLLFSPVRSFSPVHVESPLACGSKVPPVRGTFDPADLLQAP